MYKEYKINLDECISICGKVKKKKGKTNVGKPTEFLYIKNKVSCA